MTHEWIPSNLGHGKFMCKWCRITVAEANALGEITAPCPNHPENEKAMSHDDGEKKGLQYSTGPATTSKLQRAKNAIYMCYTDSSVSLDQALENMEVLRNLVEEYCDALGADKRSRDHG